MRKKIMRRIWITLLLIALATLLTVPAAGKGKPDEPGKPDPPDEPDAVGGYTCLADSGPFADILLAKDDFVFELGGRKTGLPGNLCVDVMSQGGSWKVSVIDGDGGRSMSLIARDSHGPGDSCGGVGVSGADEIYSSTFTLDAIPAATVNACGTQFAEWIEDYPGTGDPLWDADAICKAALGPDAEAPCGVFDELPDAHPLVLQVSFSGSNYATAEVCVDLPPHEDDIPAVCR